MMSSNCNVLHQADCSFICMLKWCLVFPRVNTGPIMCQLEYSKAYIHNILTYTQRWAVHVDRCKQEEITITYIIPKQIDIPAGDNTPFSHFFKQHVNDKYLY